MLEFDSELSATTSSSLITGVDEAEDCSEEDSEEELDSDEELEADDSDDDDPRLEFSAFNELPSSVNNLSDELATVELVDKLSFSVIRINNEDDEDEDEKLKLFSLSLDETADELEDEAISYITD